MQKRESCLHDRTLLCENPFGGYATADEMRSILEVGSEQLQKEFIQASLTSPKGKMGLACLNIGPD